MHLIAGESRLKQKTLQPSAPTTLPPLIAAATRAASPFLRLNMSLCFRVPAHALMSTAVRYGSYQPLSGGLQPTAPPCPPWVLLCACAGLFGLLLRLSTPANATPSQSMWVHTAPTSTVTSRSVHPYAKPDSVVQRPVALATARPLLAPLGSLPRPERHATATAVPVLSAPARSPLLWMWLASGSAALLHVLYWAGYARARQWAMLSVSGAAPDAPSPSATYAALASDAQFPAYDAVCAADVAPAVRTLVEECDRELATLEAAAPAAPALARALLRLGARAHRAWHMLALLRTVDGGVELRRACETALPELSACALRVAQSGPCYAALEAGARATDLGPSDRAVVDEAVAAAELAGARLDQDAQREFRSVAAEAADARLEALEAGAQGRSGGEFDSEALRPYLQWDAVWAALQGLVSQVRPTAVCARPETPRRMFCRTHGSPDHSHLLICRDRPRCCVPLCVAG